MNVNNLDITFVIKNYTDNEYCFTFSGNCAVYSTFSEV